MIKNKKIIATYLVREELQKGDDELLEYVKKKIPHLFLEPTAKEQKIVKVIINNPSFSKWATGTKNKADPFVVALAKVFNLIVVTYENPRATANKIPAACRLLEVECIDFITFLRQENFQIG